jgi:hypothetical protein
MALIQLVSYGAQDMYLTDSNNMHLREYNLIVENNKYGFKVKKIIGYGVMYEYAMSKNKFDMAFIENIYFNDSTIYLSDDLEENLSIDDF